MSVALALKIFWSLWVVLMAVAVAADSSKPAATRGTAAVIQIAFLLSILFFWGV